MLHHSSIIDRIYSPVDSMTAMEDIKQLGEKLAKLKLFFEQEEPLNLKDKDVYNFRDLNLPKKSSAQKLLESRGFISEQDICYGIYVPNNPTIKKSSKVVENNTILSQAVC
uniref:Peroxin-14 n=1 Tax=Rhabditophanes sp. KR3021 TaxID=114890 RepID=A0AC35UCJ5_9BILA